jgi:hypothetical protein
MDPSPEDPMGPPLRCRAVALALILAPLPEAAPGATFVASELTDAADPTPDDGICDVDPAEAGDQCTLRAAVQTTNALSGPDTVQLLAGTYVLSLRRSFDDYDESGDLDVYDTLEVLGQGAGVTILDARKLKHRIFDVDTPGGLDLVGVTLQRGSPPSPPPGFDPESPEGGCLRSEGDLVVINSVITRCKSRGNGGGIRVDGGTLVLQDTLLSGNRARVDGGGIQIQGGDALIDRVTLSGNRARMEGGGIGVSAGTATISNATVSGNRARAGGGVSNEEGGTLAIRSSTIAFNKARLAPALRDEDAGFTTTTTLQNSIVHAKKKDPCAGSFVSEGGNLESAASCGLALATDQSGVDPLLAPLADNGGATPTHALEAGSPAIDSGLDAACPPTDQRGQARVDLPGVGSSVCDVGAFEATP